MVPTLSSIGAVWEACMQWVPSPDRVDQVRLPVWLGMVEHNHTPVSTQGACPSALAGACKLTAAQHIVHAQFTQ